MDELEFHKLMIEYLSASDERPKNIELKGKPQGTSGFKSFIGTTTLAYNERYHKWKIMEILEYSILSGYEVDSSIYYTGFDRLMYKKINVSEGVSIVISREDYERLWDEAFKNTHMTMDYLKKNAKLPIATDDNGDEVILQYLIIPKTE